MSKLKLGRTSTSVEEMGRFGNRQHKFTISMNIKSVTELFLAHVYCKACTICRCFLIILKVCPHECTILSMNTHFQSLNGLHKVEVHSC